MTDLPMNGELAGMTDRLRSFARDLLATPASRRSWILEGFSLSLPDPDELIRGINAQDPNGPPPECAAVGPRTDATLADIRRLMSDTSWPWPGWLAGGSLTALASDPGIGKTLLAMALARVLWSGRPWPDGQANPLPAETRTLWVPGDHHYPQLLELTRQYDLPDDSVVLNASQQAPTSGHDLDDPATLEALAQRIAAWAPGLVIIDTVQMTTGRNLGKPEEACQYFGPLMGIATETKTPFLLLTHLSKEAQALGRRIVGASRVVWKLTHPDPEGQPDRRKLWVDKSYALKPPALGMTIATEACSFDFEPPRAAASGKPGRAPVKLEACKKWLTERLTPNPAPVKDIRSEAEGRGYTVSLLYASFDALELDEYVVDRRKWWKIPSA
jgi:hypothetical protein